MSRRRHPHAVSEARVLCPCGAIAGHFNGHCQSCGHHIAADTAKEWRKSVPGPMPALWEGMVKARRGGGANAGRSLAARDGDGTRPPGSDRGLRAPDDSRPAGRPGLSTPSRGPDGRRAGLGPVPRGVGFARIFVVTIGDPNLDYLGRLALSGPQLPRLSEGHALDVPHVFLKQRRALAGCAVRAGLAQGKASGRARTARSGWRSCARWWPRASGGVEAGVSDAHQELKDAIATVFAGAS